MPPDGPVTHIDRGSQQRVGDFELISEIGRGGMGIVYRALDLKLARTVALKRPKPEFVDHPEFVRRFLREARTSSRLLHPNITAVFAAFELEGVPWMVMELIEGGSLRSRLKSGPPLSIPEVITHAEGIADALRLAHEYEVLHLDINPNNILLGNDGRARLTDFGLARARVSSEGHGAPGSVVSWAASEVAGTPGYMAPEQVMGRPLDPRTDIFSFGVLLYEMCTGQSAFPRHPPGEWLHAVLNTEPPPARSCNPDVPETLDHIITRAIAKKPADRYRSALELLGDLRALRWQREAGISDQVLRDARTQRRARTTLVALGAAALAIASAALLMRGRSNTRVIIDWKPRQLTNTPGWEARPALSPDGTLVAYISNESGNADVWLLDIAAGKTQRLTEDPAADRDPAWFPDGQSLAFNSERSGVLSIYRVLRDGSEPKLLVVNGECPTVAPDGERIAYSTRSQSGFLRIAVASLTAPSDSRPLTGDQDGLWDHRDPAWSPDGTTICYADFRDLWLVPAAGGEARRLTNDQGPPHRPTWSPDGAHVFFGSYREGTRALWRVAVPNGALERLTVGTGPEIEPALSHDGRSLVYSTLSLDLDVALRELPTGRLWRVGSSRTESSPTISPDGTQLAFTSNRLGKSDLWLQKLSADGPVGSPGRLTDLPGSIATPTFTPDGAWLLFFRVIGQRREIWWVPTSGGVASRLIAHGRTCIHPAVAPDGTQVAFVSDADGREHLWVASLDRSGIGAPRKLTRGEASDLFPSWSPDGGRLAFVRQDGEGSNACVVEVDGAATPRRATDGVRVFQASWLPDHEALLVSGSWVGARPEIRRVSLADRSTARDYPEIDFGEIGDYGSFSVGARGRLLAHTFAKREGDLWLVQLPRSAP
jgi:Tol biopolymer transport system component/serine/threonine protein kinase